MVDRSAYGVLLGRPGEGDHFADVGVDRMIILKLIFMKEGWQGLDYSG
jgi:hypothetical protein